MNDLKLNDKIKALNSTRVFKKITPKYDASWYIKWVSSFFGGKYLGGLLSNTKDDSQIFESVITLTPFSIVGFG